MLSGVVNVITTTPGNLTLQGDGSNNVIEMTQTTVPNTFLITGLNGTVLEQNVTPFPPPILAPTYASLTVNGIYGDIFVDLGGGNTTFTFDGTGALGSPPISNVPQNLTITNENGSHTNILTNLLINSDLTVQRAAGAAGYAELRILNTTVTGDTTVNNTDGSSTSNGDSFTKIDNSWLQGDNDLAGDSLYLHNGDGNNVTTISGNSQFGTGGFISPSQPIVQIINGNGGSQTMFTGASQTAGFGTTTVYGGLKIINGKAPQLDENLVSFDQMNVLGAVDIENADSNTMTIVTQTELGSQLTNPEPNVGTGGPLNVYNNQGYDSFTMKQSTLPWGLYINNDVDGENQSNWGSDTDIEQSHIGTRLPIGPIGSSPDYFPQSLSLPSGVAFLFKGDNGADIVNIQDDTFGGEVALYLYNGNNSASFTVNTTMPALYITSGNGKDYVLIDNSTISQYVNIYLGSGADTLEIDDENFSDPNMWPSSLLGYVLLDGSDGVDTAIFKHDIGVPNNLDNFEFVTNSP